ncbi:NusG domain II-containing protein [Tetragenococcus halophilus]|uniref:NusG domain II-containing protein n=1 Tax=Tetragenococcus halophilus TaxID=51669 RepID=UPI0009F1EAF2|nr:NusG domain II-containing protein [Tetragenococcus halophilus]
MFKKKKLKAFSHKAHMKIGDVIIIAILVLASFLPIVIFYFQQDQNQGQAEEATEKSAIVRIDGKEVDRFSLNKDNAVQKTYHPADGKYNIVEVRDGQARVKEDNSPDQIAVNTGWISEPGETSICLPHKLVIEIYEEDAEDTLNDL